ncbi:MAG: DUF456 domain-containing protein [Candidatus Omnitrophica bacterium]|nr:DUF456 domain-containing protein [Candidatus Omnitrophota bacterium]
MSIVLIVLGFILNIVGIIGCIIPILPGPVLNFAALILLQFTVTPHPFSTLFLITMGLLAVGISLLDNILPLMGAKLYGATKYGIVGALIGMIIGLILFPPFGLIIGTMGGAIIGEYIGGKKGGQALKSGIGSFLMSLLAIILKLTASLVMMFYFIKIIF